MNLHNRWFVRVVVLVVFVCSTFGKDLPGKCFTPDGKPGACLLLKQCPSVNKLANDYETRITLDTLQFLINSQCTIRGGVLTVCCSFEELDATAEATGNSL
ncbi:uncharacterized protein LOC109533431 [Dendroctonus ponderosae]|uniref:uncharacterized protein LOC109533431 n=1 Tax=Dendroctonus ponderosae TaxID=77166 RepID=UPI0020357C11|nr:uncharacterized protein LOC109533431 [Dendroctonus ponderosae]KAH1027737.1 hypothetical protein HUJ05_001191 [Dendroctonus ponderosae]